MKEASCALVQCVVCKGVSVERSAGAVFVCSRCRSGAVGSKVSVEGVFAVAIAGAREEACGVAVMSPERVAREGRIRDASIRMARVARERQFGARWWEEVDRACMRWLLDRGMGWGLKRWNPATRGN